MFSPWPNVSKFLLEHSAFAWFYNHLCEFIFVQLDIFPECSLISMPRYWHHNGNGVLSGLIHVGDTTSSAGMRGYELVSWLDNITLTVPFKSRGTIFFCKSFLFSQHGSFFSGKTGNCFLQHPANLFDFTVEKLVCDSRYIVVVLLQECFQSIVNDWNNNEVSSLDLFYFDWPAIKVGTIQPSLMVEKSENLWPV